MFSLYLNLTLSGSVYSYYCLLLILKVNLTDTAQPKKHKQSTNGNGNVVLLEILFAWERCLQVKIFDYFFQCLYTIWWIKDPDPVFFPDPDPADPKRPDPDSNPNLQHWVVRYPNPSRHYLILVAAIFQLLPNLNLLVNTFDTLCSPAQNISNMFAIAFPLFMHISSHS